MPTDILDDIWECAADMQAQALDQANRYKGHDRYQKRAQEDLDCSNRVLTWVKKQRKTQCSLNQR